MFAKLIAITVVVGGGACGLLALRQSRLQVASELAQTQLRICSADERLWVLRAEVAAGVTPGRVERMARSLGPMKPIVDGAPPVLVAFSPREGEPGFIGPSKPAGRASGGGGAAGSGAGRREASAESRQPAARSTKTTKPARSQPPVRSQPSRLAQRGVH